jgi:hypothetical protein
VNNFGGLIPVPQTIPGRGTVTTNPALPTEFFNLGDRLIPSPQTINFPYQSLPAQFLPASITPPNNLNSTLPIALIVPTFPNKTATVNQLQLAPALITFPKTKTFDFSPPTLSTFTATPQPTVKTDLNTDDNEDDFPKFGIERILTTPSSTTTKTDFADLDENERTTVLDGGLFNRTLD